MRSVILESFGNPQEVLTLGERPLPEPGPGQVRVRMSMSPIHNHDLAIVRGVYGYKPPLPATPGTEAVGTVDALGEGVTSPAKGQRVMMAGATATWAEYFLAPAAKLIPVPDALPDEAACQLIAMPLSAAMLLEDLQLKPGEWMVQNTANGAVGKTVAGLAKARGIHVVNLVRRDAGIAELEALGIANVVSTEQAGWQERVKSITGEAPILRAVDSIGGDAANQIAGVMAVGGTLVSFGAMSGKPLVIGADNLIFKQATVKGFWGAKRSESTPPAELAKLIGELMKAVATGALKLPVEAAFDIADAAKAAGASDVPGRTGKIVLTAK
ncbi:zinc-binding dehydrogenase [Variovorax robiniae]|uniref:enoyl-[acyl-carrier-protein] reductase n=1 Tax=Variovorax robiniae TaxID=1836199 RepID=A0ABU8X4N4_9BURK